MKTVIEIAERSNEIQLIKIVFGNGDTFNLTVYPSGELEVNSGFSGAILIKPCVTNEIIIKHDK